MRRGRREKRPIGAAVARQIDALFRTGGDNMGIHLPHGHGPNLLLLQAGHWLPGGAFIDAAENAREL